jgi:hypothetical protein
MDLPPLHRQIRSHPTEEDEAIEGAEKEVHDGELRPASTPTRTEPGRTTKISGGRVSLAPAGTPSSSAASSESRLLPPPHTGAVAGPPPRDSELRRRGSELRRQDPRRALLRQRLLLRGCRPNGGSAFGMAVGEDKVWMSYPFTVLDPKYRMGVVFGLSLLESKGTIFRLDWRG